MRRRQFILAATGAATGAIAALAGVPPRAARAQLGDILTAPKTLFDRAIEARGAADIAKDNEIVLAVNGVMADVGTIKASTEIYEQRMLLTGLFDDKAAYDKFEKGVRAVKDVKRLYWHVAYLGKAEQEKRKAELIDWPAVIALEAKAKGRLIGTRGVADVNFRVAGDAFSTLYLLGRARSQEELNKALARLRDGDGVKKVINYADVKP